MPTNEEEVLKDTWMELVVRYLNNDNTNLTHSLTWYVKNPIQLFMKTALRLISPTANVSEYINGLVYDDLVKRGLLHEEKSDPDNPNTVRTPNKMALLRLAAERCGFVDEDGKPDIDKMLRGLSEKENGSLFRWLSSFGDSPAERLVTPKKVIERKKPKEDVPLPQPSEELLAKIHKKENIPIPQPSEELPAENHKEDDIPIPKPYPQSYKDFPPPPPPEFKRRLNKTLPRGQDIPIPKAGDETVKEPPKLDTQKAQSSGKMVRRLRNRAVEMRKKREEGKTPKVKIKKRRVRRKKQASLS